MSRIPDKETGPICSELKQTLKYMLKHNDTMFYRIKSNISGHKELHKIYDLNYILAENELIGFKLTFLTIIFTIILLYCHVKIIYTALMELDVFQHIYIMDAVSQPPTT